MTYWLTISLIVSLAMFIVRIAADVQQINGDSQTKSVADSQPLNSGYITNDNLFEKRASFMPSRGKKEQLLQSTDNTDKRQGFLPMRGRKDYDTQTQGWYVGGSPYQFQNEQDEKRAGFMPMRGRKNSAYDSNSLGPNPNFYDTYPLELNDIKRMASFMPMRGRKYDINYEQPYGQTSYVLPQPYSQSSQNIDNTNWMEGEHSLSNRAGLTSSMNGVEVEKKANSFFGSRGKRSAINDADNQIVPKISDKRSVGLSSIDDHHKYNENFFATRG